MNNMDEKHGITITARDRIMRAWENSMQLVRDYELYSKEIENKQTADLFALFAEDEGLHASRLAEILRDYEK